jgi:Domain of unknown function (DUF1996)
MQNDTESSSARRTLAPSRVQRGRPGTGLGDGVIRSIRAIAAVAFLVAAAFVGAGSAEAHPPIPGFEVFCFYSHSARDDPIVDPGMPGGAMHLHDFSGNNSTRAASTPTSLRASTTTCQLHADTAAYWAPVLYSHGVAVHPDRLHSYYRWGNIKDVAHIQPMPADLKMIAGNPMATAQQSLRVIGWNCGVRGSALHHEPVSCRGQKIVLHVFFPNCWDGVHLDSADHAGHMAYSHNGRCPASHPVAVPRLAEDYGYPITDATAITLASGSYVTAHADFWNTWNQSAMVSLTRSCINRGRQCGPQSG